MSPVEEIGFSKNLNKLTHLLPVSFLILITSLTFLPSIHHAYVSWDDPLSLDYVLIRSIQWEGLKKIFTTILNTTYTPLTITSFALEYHFFKYNILIYHLNNVLLHIAVVILSYMLGIRLGLKKWTAFIATLIFAVHPMKVESVSWITERKDLLYAFFYLNALHVYLSYIKTKQTRTYILSIILGFLSMLSKPMALSLPLILLLCDWYYERPFKIKCLVEKIPYFLYILPLTFVTYSQNYHTIIINENILNAVLIFIWTFSFYLSKFFFPLTLVPLYAVPEPIHWSNPAYLSSLVIFTITVYTVYRLRHDRWFLFCFMFYISSLFLLFRFNRMENLAVVADRFIYLPSLGLCFFLAKKIEERLLSNNKIQIKTVGSVIICLLTILLICKNISQQQVWKSSLNLWSQVVQHEPSIAIGHNNLGFSYIESKQWTLAEQSFKKAIEVYTEYAFAYANLGSLYYLQNKFELAVTYLNKALQIDPTHDKSYNMLGLINEKNGQLDQALINYTKAVENSPEFEEYYLNRVRILKKKGLLKEALEDLKKLSKIFPEFPSSYMEQGEIYTQLNDLPSAMANYQQVIKIKPDSHEAYNNLGVIFATQNQLNLAINALNKSIEINPTFAASFLNRSKVYNKSGNLKNALEDAQQAQLLGAPDTDPYLKELKNKINLK